MDEKIEKEFASGNDNTSNTNFKDICRLCGNYDNQLMSTFSGDGISNYLYGKIIQHLTAIKISKADNLPSQVCYQCISTLITWDDLFEACLEVDKRLRRILMLMENKKTAKSNSSVTTNATDSALGSSAVAVGRECGSSCNVGNNEEFDLDIMNVDFSDIANLDDFNSDEMELSTLCFDNADAADCDFSMGQDGFDAAESAAANGAANEFFGWYNETDVAEIMVESETSPYLFQPYSNDQKFTTALSDNDIPTVLPLDNIDSPSANLLLPNNVGQFTYANVDAAYAAEMPVEENTLFGEERL